MVEMCFLASKIAWNGGQLWSPTRHLPPLQKTWPEDENFSLAPGNLKFKRKFLKYTGQANTNDISKITMKKNSLFRGREASVCIAMPPLVC